MAHLLQPVDFLTLAFSIVETSCSERFGQVVTMTEGVPIKITSVTIRTARLLLRQALPSDLNDFHEIMSDADVMRYWY